MSNNPQALDAFYRAQTLAYWSFTGLVIPLLGIILASISRSRLRLLTGGSHEEQAELDRVYRVAGWGLGLSIASLVLIVVGWFCWGFLIGAAAVDSAEQLQSLEAGVMPE